MKEKITLKTKAIVLGHTFGFYLPIEDFIGIDIPIIEDISHVIGAETDEIPIGSLGTIVVSSLSPGCIITTGNGAIILTNNSRYFSAMKDRREDNDKNRNIRHSICLLSSVCRPRYSDPESPCVEAPAMIKGTTLRQETWKQV